MGMQRQFFAISLVLFLVSMVSVNSSDDYTAYACSCMQPLSPDEELPNYDAVFSGKVTGIEERISNDPVFSSADLVLVTLDVDTVWKGEKKDTMTVKTAQSSASCGFYFEENREYIVYASQYDDEYLEVSLCSRTGLLSDAIEDLQELGPGIPIKSESKSETLPPLKQFKSGISAENIQCKEELYLVIKHDNTPACVKQDSILELDKRGWIDVPITHADRKYTESEDSKSSSTEFHEIPVHVYEIWDSQRIVIHGNVDRQDESIAVEIQIKDQNGDSINTAKVMPDDSGRFIHGVTKFIPNIPKSDPKWEDVTSYDVSAFYKYPPISSAKESDALNNITLDKDKIPLTSEQISDLSYDEIIKIIKDWNSIGGSSPFTVVSIIGAKETYELGETMPFAVQKSGYGNPCHDQGVVVFDDDTKTRIATGFYLEMCNDDPEKEIMEPFDYLIPYNYDIFPKLAPITKPGNYVMVAGADESAKSKHRFTVLDSDFVYDYKVVYKMQKGSQDSTQMMTIDLNSGMTTMERPDGATTESYLDTDTLLRLDSEITENDLVADPWTSHSLGEGCETCNFGIMQIYVGDTLVHFLLFDDENLSSVKDYKTELAGESPYFFSIVDCISSKNDFDTYWISDLGFTNKDSYSDQECSRIGNQDDTENTASVMPTRNDQKDYDYWVNDKPKENIPEGAGNLYDIHEHASILVKIFGDKFDFSGAGYQIKDPYIHFEGRDGNTVHIHATGIPLEFLFETMNMKITDNCFVFAEGREFCNIDEYSLKFYINEEQIDSITDYVLSQDDKILISYGDETQDEIAEHLEELNLQEIIS